MLLGNVKYAGELVRVDRRGYSGSIHAARREGDDLRTLCGKRVGVHWHVSPSPFNASEIECKGCVKALAGVGVPPDKDLVSAAENAARAQQIQRGLEPAETILQLVDAIRQDTAGIGACVSSIRFIADTRGDVPKSVLEWLDRLAAHAKRMENKCALALAGVGVPPPENQDLVSAPAKERQDARAVPIQSARVLCRECANGRHVCCEDDGQTARCDCPCSDDFDPGGSRG